MAEALRIELRRRPSTVGYMARALYPSAGLAKAGGFPSIIVSWRQHQVDRRHLDTFLDAWLKGPVYYGSAVTLRAAASESDSVFALLADEDERPRIVGRWSLAKAK